MATEHENHQGEPLRVKPRASERVRQYLEDQLADAKGTDRIKLPPVQELSRHLKVSTATIYHIFKDLVEEGRMHTVAGQGSYLVTRPPRQGGHRPLCIGLTCDVTSTAPRWRTLISHAILQAITAHRPSLNLRPLPREAFQTNTHKDVLMGEVDEVDALIFFTSAREFAESEESLVELYESRKKPVVRFGSPGIAAGTNFVAFDHFNVACEIGHAWSSSGRRRIVYLTRESLNATTSTLLTLIGLQSGVARGGLVHGDVRVILADDILEENGYQAIKKALQNGSPTPDAIFCAGDFLALGALRALAEAGLSIPGDVSVIGGTGLDLSGTLSPNMTRFSVPYDIVAEKLIGMALQRIRRDAEPMPGIYVPVSLIGGASSTAKENTLLRKTGLLK